MNERGFTLIEMLVSLSILLMISTMIIPTLMEVMTERKNLAIRNEGNLLLLEQINRYNSDKNFNNIIEKDGVIFTFYLEDKQLIVKWMNRDNQEELCSYEVAY